MRNWLPLAHLAIAAVIVVWDVVLCGRIAQLRLAPRVFAAVTGLAGLMIVPGLIVMLATSTVITGRAIGLLDWIWPVVLVMFAVQAVYALARRLVNPTWGVPIAIYDIVLAVIGVARFLTSHGLALPEPFLVLLGAQASALYVAASPLAFSSPLFFLVPMVSPAFPALRGLTASFRAVMSAIAIGWLVLTGTQINAADEAIVGYRARSLARLTERPAGDFVVGLKIFPDLAGPPPPPAIVNDLALADTLGVDVVSLVIVPEVTNAVLDSVNHALNELRRDSTVLIVSLGYRGKILPSFTREPLDEEKRIAAVRRIVRRLHPDILLPAEDPYGIGARLVGRIAVDQWKSYLSRAAVAAKRLDRQVQIGVSIASFDLRDSALYAWAASSGSPIDVVGFSLWPGRGRTAQTEGLTRAADRWMRVTPPMKDHWVFAAGGFPLTYGEGAQEAAIWQALAWATARPAIKGIVVYEAGDYGLNRGLRAPNGRLRPAAFAVMRGLRGLREAAVGPTAPAP